MSAGLTGRAGWLAALVADVGASADADEVVRLALARTIEGLQVDAAVLVDAGVISAAAGVPLDATGIPADQLDALAAGRVARLDFAESGTGTAVGAPVGLGRVLVVARTPAGTRGAASPGSRPGSGPDGGPGPDEGAGEGGGFDASEVDLVRTVAALVEQAVVAHGRFAELGRRQALAACLSRIHQAVARHLPLRDIFDVVTDSVRELFGDEVSALRLTDADDPDSLLLVSCQGLPADQTRRLWRASLQDAGISGRAVASGELVLVDRHDGDNGIEIKELTQFGLHAAMAAPVRDTGKIVGALVVASDRPDRTYAEVDRQTLVALAGAVSAAISDAGTLDTMYQAFHDPLTGLTSRALFLDRLTHALACADRERTGTGMLLIGLDRFRTINEGLGHAVGDQLLAAVAERIRAAVRNVDTAARFDGDEFAVLLHHLSNRHQAVLIARRVLHALRAPFSIMDRRVFITASIGVAFADPGQDDPQPLLRRADQALASAKRNGKGRYEVFTPPAHASAHNPVELENDLRQALERDELRLRYQPIVELADGRVTGFEALVRWEHPVHGMIPPLDFIPLAEESDLIVPIGTWVLEQACLQCARWNAERPADSPLTVSVNLSARQLQHADLCRMVSTALDRAGLPATSLTLEITESMLVQDSDATIRRLQQLKDVGVRLAIDDFGTGYSSLAYLRRFPVDIIKIDKIFVDDLPRGDGATLTRAIVGLGRSLRVATIAEGIEAADQCAPLRESGCELGQGYYFAKPLTPEEATGLAVSGSG